MKINCPYCTKELTVPATSLRVGNPTLTCTGCNGKFKAKEEKKPENKKQEPAQEETAYQKNKGKGTGETQYTGGSSQKSNAYFAADPGWLVVHDENTKQQTFTLKEGKQTVGRKSESKPCAIMVETGDMYMSRNHFNIEVNKFANGMYGYSISDCNATNHTYVNLKKLRDGDEMYLKDGDTIQAGETKIVFKSNAEAKDSHQATQLVVGNNFNKTVLINK